VKKISVVQRWDSRDVRVSRLDLRKLRFASAPLYEFRVGLGKTQLVVKFSDEVGSWRKFRIGKSDFGSLVSEVGALGLLDTFKLEGPFELRVGGDDKLSLLLPVRNFIQFSA
jgi:signal peptidase I